MIPARVRRVCETFKEVVGEIVQRDLKDPGVGFITITEVEMSADLRHARVWVSVMGSPEERDETMQALERAKGFIKSEAGRRMRLRYTPEVAFLRDESTDRSERLETLLRELRLRESGIEKRETGEVNDAGSQKG